MENARAGAVKPARDRANRVVVEYVLQAALLLMLLVPLFPGVFFRGEKAFPANFFYIQPLWQQVPPDLRPQNALYTEIPMQVGAWYTLSTEALRHGQWPLWNPFQFTGTPLLAGLQSAIFYPPRLVFSFADYYDAFTLFVLLKLWIAGMAAYLAGRALRLVPEAATFFSIAYMLGGYVLTWCYFPTSDSMAWLPLLMAGMELILRNRRRSGFALVYISATLMLLAGGAQHTVTSGILLAVYFLARLLSSGMAGAALPKLGLALLAALAAAATAAVQLLPFIEFVSNSQSLLDFFYGREAASWAYAWPSLISLWAPRYFGTYFEGNFWGEMNPGYMMMLYAGVPIFMAPGLLPAMRNAPVPVRRQLYALWGMSLLSLSAAMGLPPFSLLRHLPFFEGVRPVYYVAFAACAMPLAAATAFQNWYAMPKRTLRPLSWPVVLVVAAVLISAAHLWFSSPLLNSYEPVLARNGTLFDMQNLEPWTVLPYPPHGTTLRGYVQRNLAWTGLLAGCTLALLAIPGHRGPWRRLGMYAMAGVVAVDLVVASLGLMPTSSEKHLHPRSELVEYLQQKAHPYRVSFFGAGCLGYPTLFGIESVMGYDAMVPRRFAEFHKLAYSAPRSYNALTAAPTHLFTIPQEEKLVLPEGFEPDRAYGGIQVARCIDALPRAYLVGRAERLESPEMVLKAIEEPAFDPMEAVLTDSALGPQMTAGRSGPAGEARVIEWTSNRVVVECHADRSAVLVLADAYFPGWRARLNGTKDVAVFPAFHLFRAVAVPEGKHVVEFEYLPYSFIVGAAVSVFALVVLVLTAAIVMARQTEARRG